MSTTHRSEQLANIPQWRDEVTLVPYSGVQILDFGFSLDDVSAKSARFVERVVGGDAENIERALIPLTGNEETDAEIEGAGGPDDDHYSVRPVAALEPFLSKWVPVPVLRIKNDRGPGGEERFDPGPSSWARMRTDPAGAPDSR